MFWLQLDALVAGVCMLPLLLLLRTSLYRDRKTFLLHLLFALYLAVLLLAVGFPWVGRLTFEPSGNLVLFRDFLAAGTALNVLLFVPLGAFLPLLGARYRAWRPAVLFGLGTSLFIEVMQLFTFRATDVNDLLTNTAGTLLGWLLVRGATRGCTRGPLGLGGERAVAATCAVAVLTMFLVQPVVSGWLWNLICSG